MDFSMMADIATKPIDLRKAECPYCHQVLKKIPAAKTKCPHCAGIMFVRTRLEDFARVVVTITEAAQIDADYSSYLASSGSSRWLPLRSDDAQFYPDVSDWPAVLTQRESTAEKRQPGAYISKPSIARSIQPHGFFNQINEEAANYAHNWAAEMVGKKWIDGKLVDNPDTKWAITDSTRDWLRDAIEKAFTEGASPAQLAKSIQASQTFSKSVAHMIAHTEIGNANIQSHARVARAGGATHKRSFHSADHDIDDVCSLAAAAGEVPIDLVYSGGLKWPLYHPNCRCSISFYVRKPVA
jgi:hypothetical protein